MKLASLAIVSISILGLATVACSSDTTSSDGDSGASLATNESQLVADDSDASSTDDDLESGVDEPLSGAIATNAGAPAAGAKAEEIIAKVKENAGKFFSPAGCLTSTVSGDTVTHVFDNCTGPYGLKTFDGTITSSYKIADGKLTITHSANDFRINGATISGQRVVTYSESGTVWTKTRTGNWSGNLASGATLSHQASFTTTYDTSTKCMTRDGSAQTSVANRNFERVVDGYKRCGIGRFGCPESGEITLTRTNGSGSLTVKIDYLGGTKYTVTRPSGRVVQRTLVCNPSAS